NRSHLHHIGLVKLKIEKRRELSPDSRRQLGVIDRQHRWHRFSSSLAKGGQITRERNRSQKVRPGITQSRKFENWFDGFRSLAPCGGLPQKRYQDLEQVTVDEGAWHFGEGAPNQRSKEHRPTGPFDENWCRSKLSRKVSKQPAQYVYLRFVG